MTPEQQAAYFKEQALRKANALKTGAKAPGVINVSPQGVATGAKPLTPAMQQGARITRTPAPYSAATGVGKKLLGGAGTALAAIEGTQALDRYLNPEARSERARAMESPYLSMQKFGSDIGNVAGELASSVGLLPELSPEARQELTDEQYARIYGPASGGAVKSQEDYARIANEPGVAGATLPVPTAPGQPPMMPSHGPSELAAPAPTDTIGGSSKSSTETSGPVGMEYDFNPNTQQFEPKPYQPQAVENVSISDVLGDTSLSGLGGLYAVNLASKMAQGETAENVLREKNRQEAAQSEEDWAKTNIDWNKYEIEKALAPFQARESEARRKQMKSQTVSKQEAKSLKMSEALIKEGGRLMQEAAKMRADGYPEKAELIERQAQALMEGKKLTKTAPAIEEYNPGLFDRYIRGKQAIPAQPAQYGEQPIDFKVLR
jgi:hypothetical protein